LTGNLIIISSPSGGGKGTLINAVRSVVPDLGYSVSYTTRDPRPGEQDGVHYHFASKDQFERLRAEGSFLESAEVHGNLYGTSIDEVERIKSSGKDVILEIDVQGASAVLARVPEAVSVFIMPPSFAALSDRLTARATENNEQVSIRLSNAIREIAHYQEFSYVVINDEIEAATGRLAAIILAERQRRSRQTLEINAILDSFDNSKSRLTGE
jgi:guanylate kinase